MIPNFLRGGKLNAWGIGDGSVTISQSQQRKKQDANFVMIERHITQTGYGKRDPGRYDT
jgi:hypothetical protein